MVSATPDIAATSDALLLDISQDGTNGEKDVPGKDTKDGVNASINKSASLLLDLGIFESQDNQLQDDADKLFSDSLDQEEEFDEKSEEEDTAVRETSSRKIFVFLQEIVATFAPQWPEIGFKIYLDLANAASNCASLTLKADREPIENSPTKGDYNSMAFEFMMGAFNVYENDISDSKARSMAITAMTGTLLQSCGYEKHDYETLITKCVQYGAKLFKKPHQCKIVTLCSHLFFTGDRDDQRAYRNPQRVLECLQRSLKIADACSVTSPASVALFIEILEHYIYYYEKENPIITHKFVSGLIALIKEHLGVSDASLDADARAHFQEIERYIQRKKDHPDTKERFAPIKC